MSKAATDGASAPANPPLSARGFRTKQALLAAARTVFERDGFLNTRITDIAQTAGLSHGTFYTYFDGKEAAFASLIDDLRVEMLGIPDLDGDHEEPESETARSPHESIRRANSRYVQGYERNSRMMIVWEEAATFVPAMASLLYQNKLVFVERAERAIRHWQDTDSVDPRLDPRYTAHALTGMVSRFSYTWFAQREEFDYDIAVEHLTLLWCNALGLGPAESREPSARTSPTRRTPPRTTKRTSG